MQITKMEDVKLTKEELEYQLLDLSDIDRQLKELKARKDTIKAGIMEYMEENNIKKLATEDATATLLPSKAKESVDTKSMIADYPNIAKQYTKMVKTKASLRIVSNN
jgi:regulator of replication initiation timing